jgi:hypothetical protein
MSIEDRVRTATRDRAHLVRDIRPLDLPAAKAARPARAPWARGWSAWLAPVTAAAVVVALAITLVSLREVRNEPSVSPTASAPAGSGTTAAAAVLPRYYAALDDPSGTAFNDQKITSPVDLVVGDTSTGRRIAAVAPPKGQTFAGLTAEAGDREFVVAAESLPVAAGVYSAAPVAWYLLRITPGAAKAFSLTKLSIPGQPAGTQIDGIALSVSCDEVLAPDCGELAVLYQRGVWGTGGKTGPLTLSVYSVSTGQALRTWTQPTNGFPAGYGWYWGRYSNSSITWLADGRTLAFDDGTNSGENGPPLGGAFSNVKIRTLDLARPSGSLLADSKVVFSSQNHWCDTLQLTADGKSVLCGSYGGAYGSSTGNWGSAYNPEILEYSVATGKSRVVYRFKIGLNLGLADVLWMSPDGSTLLGSALGQERQGSRVIASVAAVGLIANGALKPAKVKLAGTPFAGQIAF